MQALSSVYTNSVITRGNYEICHDQNPGDSERYIHRSKYLGAKDAPERSEIDEFGINAQLIKNISQTSTATLAFQIYQFDLAPRGSGCVPTDLYTAEGRILLWKRKHYNMSNMLYKDVFKTSSTVTYGHVGQDSHSTVTNVPPCNISIMGSQLNHR